MKDTVCISMRQPLISSDGPSAKFMRGFHKRHPKLREPNSESVDRGRINMANRETVDEYFQLLETHLQMMTS